MRTKKKSNPLFTTGERQLAGLAILTAVVLTLSVQVIEAGVRPSLGLYDANPSVDVTVPNVIDASPLSRTAAF